MTLELITDPSLDGLAHGFFTRKGGASSGVFSGLNCGFGSSDQHEIVAINRRRVAEALDLLHTHLVGVHQTHSARVETIDAPFDGPTPEADGIVTATKGLGLAILTADCQPVLFADRTAGVIGAAHAGWKGALGGVLEATVAAMEALGAQRKRISAVIGPSISQRNYEVGADFRDTFLQHNADFARYFTAGKAGKFHFDLPAFGLFQLKTCGIGDSRWTGHCTYAEPDRFYSYRRSVHRKEADYGRLVSVIRL